MNKKIAWVGAGVLLGVPALSVHAASVVVDCSKKASITTALGKLDKSVANSVQVIGTCTENLSIQGHKDLTITGTGGAGVAGASAASDTVYVAGGSRVTLQDLTVSGGYQGVGCDDRSTCRLINVSVQQAASTNGWAVYAQKQSAVDIYGSPASGISNNAGGGVGVFGNSSVNVGPATQNGGDPGPTISGNSGNSGFQVQDGSFLRVDNAVITGNGGFGVNADRGAVVKLFGSNISNNAFSGVKIRASVAQIGSQATFQAKISGNGNFGVQVQQLAYATLQGLSGDGVSPDLPVAIDGNNAGFSVACQFPTSVATSFLVQLDPAKGTNCW